MKGNIINCHDEPCVVLKQKEKISGELNTQYVSTKGGEYPSHSRLVFLLPNLGFGGGGGMGEEIPPRDSEKERGRLKRSDSIIVKRFAAFF